MEEEKQKLSREEILERSREENKNGDELYKKNKNIALSVGLLVFIFFVLAIWITEYVIYKEVKFSYGLSATMWGVSGAIWLTRGILNRKMSSIILGVLNCFLGIAWFVGFVLAMLR